MSITDITVTIPLERYESLLDTETRETVLRDYINRNNYADRFEMMRILGDFESANKIKEQEKKKRKEYSFLADSNEDLKDAGAD